MINNLLAVIFEADMVRVGMFNSTRLPYSVNQKTGREAQLFFRGQVLDYSSFRDEILNYADEKNLIKKMQMLLTKNMINIHMELWHKFIIQKEFANIIRPKL